MPVVAVAADLDVDVVDERVADGVLVVAGGAGQGLQLKLEVHLKDEVTVAADAGRHLAAGRGAASRQGFYLYRLA